MNFEQELNRLVHMSEAEIRKRMAEAWRRMRKTHPELARDLWKRAKKEPAKCLSSQYDGTAGSPRSQP